MGKKAKEVVGKVLLGLVYLLLSPMILFLLLICALIYLWVCALIYLWDWIRWKCFHSRLPYDFGVSYDVLFRVERILRKNGMPYAYRPATEKNGRGAFRLETGLWLIDGGSESEYFLDFSGTLYWEEENGHDSSGMEDSEEKKRGEPWRGEGEEKIPISMSIEEMLAPYAGESALVCYFSGQDGEKMERPRVHAALKDHPKTIALCELREQYCRK